MNKVLMFFAWLYILAATLLNLVVFAYTPGPLLDWLHLVIGLECALSLAAFGIVLDVLRRARGEP